MDVTARFDNLDRLIAENKLLRKTWTEGTDRACLLAALSPEVGEQKSAHACPSSLLPPWFAHLTPQMDDHGSIEKWPDFVKRYAHTVRSAALLLDAPAWRRAEYRVRALAVREAMVHTDNEEVLAVCKASVALCDRVSIGDEPTEEERSAAESAAESVAWSAAWGAAESVAWSAARSAAESAAWGATESAARSAAESAARSAAESAAESAAWDRMNDGILDILNTETIRMKEKR